MTLLLRWKALLFVLLFQNVVQAQEESLNKTESLDPIGDFIESVYSADWVTKNPDAIIAIKKCIKERITYVQVPLTADDKLPLLSSYPLMNRYNSAIVAIDYSAFDPSTFIPLTYNLPLFSNMKQAIRVDGTDYVIVIEPQSKDY